MFFNHLSFYIQTLIYLYKVQWKYPSIVINIYSLKVIYFTKTFSSLRVNFLPLFYRLYWYPNPFPTQFNFCLQKHSVA